MLTADQLACVLALLDTHPRRDKWQPLISKVEEAMKQARAAQPRTVSEPSATLSDNRHTHRNEGETDE